VEKINNQGDVGWLFGIQEYQIAKLKEEKSSYGKIRKKIINKFFQEESSNIRKKNYYIFKSRKEVKLYNVYTCISDNKYTDNHFISCLENTVILQI